VNTLALTRSLLERDTVRQEMRTGVLGPQMLTDAQLDASRRAALAPLRRKQSLWVFGYGSLIWNPQINFQTSLRVRIYGHRRALCLWSRINRGTPDAPGLVFGLLPGGSCVGVAYQIPAAQIEAETTLLWRREMLMGSYVPIWATGHDEHQKTIRVLTFRVDPQCAGFAGDLRDEEIVRTLRVAKGRFGSCSEYVRNTLDALKQNGISDERLARLCAGLVAPCPTEDAT
jgi:glutathione-specific gamma-glutamylcyclotransferase